MDGEAPPSSRRRRTVLALVLLLLILLPLYLWPLRWGVGGLPGASALSGPRPDPRSAAAVAQIPGEVWDALMGGGAPPSGLPPTGPRNLTMIAELNPLFGGGLLPDPGGSPLPESPAELGGVMVAQLGSRIEDTSGTGSDETSSTPGQGGGGTPWGGDYPAIGDPWPRIGGGLGGGPPIAPGFTLEPGDPGVPAPTPEPATLILVGSNLALLGATMWRRHRRRESSLRG